MNRACILAVWTITFPALASAADPRTTPTGPRNSASYSAGSDGDLIVVPVQIAGHRFNFAVDTGAPLCVIDSRAAKRLGPLPVSSAAKSFGFDKTVELVDLGLADSDFRFACDAGVADLSQMHMLTGNDVHGLLGMNFLRNVVVKLDFDLGIVVFERELTKSRGVRVPAVRDRYGRLLVDLTVTGHAATKFLIDTGMFVPGLGEIKSPLFQQLVNEGTIKVIGSKSTVTTVAGTIAGQKGQIDRFAIGDFEHDCMGIREGELNAIGLDYLSRYAITLDFPAESVYLQPGKRYSDLTAFDMSGLFLSRRGAWTVVENLHPGTPASKAGLQEFDRITRINGLAAESWTLLQIRRRFSGPELSEVTIAFDRGTESLKASFQLQNWQGVNLEEQTAR